MYGQQPQSPQESRDAPMALTEPPVNHAAEACENSCRKVVRSLNCKSKSKPPRRTCHRASATSTQPPQTERVIHWPREQQRLKHQSTEGAPIVVTLETKQLFLKLAGKRRLRSGGALSQTLSDSSLVFSHQQGHSAFRKQTFWKGALELEVMHQNNLHTATLEAALHLRSKRSCSADFLRKACRDQSTKHHVSERAKRLIHEAVW